MQLKTEGIVLKSKTINNDKLLTVLTKDFGVINVYATNALNSKSKYISSIDLFNYSNFIIFRYKDTTMLNNCEIIEPFFNLRKDLSKLSLATYFAEITSDLAPKEEESGSNLKLILNTLFYLQNNKINNKLLKSIYELRLLTMSGFMPDLTACCSCGQYENEKFYFGINNGLLYCDNCKPSGIQSLEINQSLLATMRHIIYCEQNKLFSFQLNENLCQRLNECTEKYLINIAEKQYQSLDFYKTIEKE